MYLPTWLTALLPARLQPYAKAVWPLLAAVAYTAVTWITTGDVDTSGIEPALGAAGAALLTLAIPNLRRA